MPTRRLCAFAGASLFLLTAACAGGFAPPTPVAPYIAAFDDAREAGLQVYDALAPAFPDERADGRYLSTLGPERLGGEDCEGRYVSDALRARCGALAAILAFNDGLNASSVGARFETRPLSYAAALASRLAPVELSALRGLGALGNASIAAGRLREGAPAIRRAVAALRADAPRLYTLARAMQADALEHADFAWLAAMDEVFDGVTGRAVPSDPAARAALDRAAARVTPMLTRAEPAYGAASLFETMARGGKPLGAAEVEAIEDAVSAAETALAEFDAIAAQWRPLASALADYDGMLAAAEDRMAAFEAGEGEAEAMIGMAERAARILTRLTDRRARR